MDASLLDDDAFRTPTIASGYAALEFTDGYATVSAVTQSEFEGYCAALGIPEIGKDERFKDQMSRAVNAADWREILLSRLQVMSVDDFLAAALIHDVPASGMNTLETVVDDPQVIHNETFIVRQHPVAGTMREVRNAPRFKGTPTSITHPAPAMGEHSDELVTSLGFNAAALREAGVIY
jgi:crotonobetainyl-CoA:carnitine CoA-transferase CaiB-like acyl-CoA transferase